MHSLGIVQWNSTRRDHPGNLGGVSGSGLVNMLDFIEDLSETSQKLIDHYADCWKKILNSILMKPARKHLKKSNSD